MKIKGIWIVLLAVVIMGAAIGTTLAFFTDAKEQSNVFTMGNVNITLNEPEFSTLTGGSMKIENVTPNQRIVKDPTITVGKDSNDAYLRVSITYEGLNDEQQTELEENIAFNDGWYKGNDSYMYYYEKVEKDQVINVFESVLIPSSWGTEIAEEFKINVKAEAIQADNFKPVIENINDKQYITNWLDNDNAPIHMK